MNNITRWTELCSKYDTTHRYWSRPGYIGGDRLMGHACNIMFGHRISGSGPDAFGGSGHWPYITLNVDFPENRDNIAFKFGEELQIFVDDFLANNGLKIPDGCRDEDYNEHR